MGLFSDMRGGHFTPGPGVDEPPPAMGFKRFLFILRNHFGKLILANVLFLAFCLPVVTIPASLCGLNMVCAQLIRTGKCYLVQDFLEGFKRGFPAKTLLGAPFCVIVAGTVLLYISGMRTVWFYIAAASACYFFIAACYFFAYSTGLYSSDGAKETLSKLFVRALLLCFARRSTPRLLPALILATIFMFLYISLLPVLALIGASLIVTLALSAF